MARGVMWLSAATWIMWLVNYGIQAGLGRALGPEAYGDFGVVLALMSVVTLAVMEGVPIASARLIAEGGANAGIIIRRSNRVQLGIVVLVFAAYAGLAGIMSNLLGDPDLFTLTLLSAFGIPTYGFFALYVRGYLNGLREFKKQSMTMFGVTVVRVALVAGLVGVGMGARGAILGYLGAPLVGLVLAWKMLGSKPTGPTVVAYKRIAFFGISTAMFAVLIFLLLNIDILAVKLFADEAQDVGFYIAAAAISRIPLYLVGGLVGGIFPYLSKSIANGDYTQTRRYLSVVMRYTLIVLVPGVALMSATSPELITFLYSADYGPGAVALEILSVALGFIVISEILGYVVVSSGRGDVAAALVVPAVVTSILLNLLLVPTHGLLGAAVATAVAGAVAMCTFAVFVLIRLGPILNIKTSVRIAFATLVVYVIAGKLDAPASLLPVVWTSLGGLYLAILVGTRELRRADFLFVAEFLHPRRAPNPVRPSDELSSDHVRLQSPDRRRSC